jgi:hypothetical protein
MVTSERWQQRAHHPAAVMGDPGLLQELPDITALLPEAGGDGEQPAAADRTLAGLDAMTDFALNYGLAQSTLGCVVGGLDTLDIQERPQSLAALQQLLAWLTDTTARPLATERVSADWVGREP